MCGAFRRMPALVSATSQGLAGALPINMLMVRGIPALLPLVKAIEAVVPLAMFGT